jgi:hypothetical protein
MQAIISDFRCFTDEEKKKVSRERSSWSVYQAAHFVVIEEQALHHLSCLTAQVAEPI